MNNEQLIKDVIRWIITTKNTEMLDDSDVDLVYKDYEREKVGNVPEAVSAQPQLYEVRAIAEQSLNSLPYGFTAESEISNLIFALLRIIDITKS